MIVLLEWFIRMRMPIYYIPAMTPVPVICCIIGATASLIICCAQSGNVPSPATQKMSAPTAIRSSQLAGELVIVLVWYLLV